MALMHHLADNGSDGFVVAGTTGEASTLTDEEQLGLIELAVAERPPGKTIVAGTGTNDTRHAVYLTERATELGADAMLSVTPYYNRPSRLGIIAPLRSGRGGHRQTDRCSTTSPAAPAPTCPPTCSPSSRRSSASTPSSRPTRTSCSRSTVSTCTPATTARSRARSTWAAPAGSSSPATSSATRCAGWSTSREQRGEIDASLRDVYETLFLTASPTCTKAALNLLGHDVGGLRLPLVEATDAGGRGGARDARAPRPRSARARHRVSATLRVLPLGGLGEIGKNMTVVEYDDRIVVVDVGLRFPTPEMVGIDLVLPDFAYLRERARGHRGDRRHARPRGSPRRAAVGAARARRTPTCRRSTAGR